MKRNLSGEAQGGRRSRQREPLRQKGAWQVYGLVFRLLG